MPVFRLDSTSFDFPDPLLAEEDGLLAVGGDLSPERLLRAYSAGIFPWPHPGYPLLWFSPDPRFVLEAEKLRVSRSLEKTIRKGIYEVRFDTAFADVVRACGKTPRPGQRGTWITREMLRGYTRLHQLGFAHSAEAWRNGRLVGGLYGISLGTMFFGESMFAEAPDASKQAFVTLVRRLEEKGIDLIDCQVETAHLARFGAEFWPRERYLAELERRMKKKTWKGTWGDEL